MNTKSRGYRGSKAHGGIETATMGLAEIRASMRLGTVRNEAIAYGVSAAAAGAGITVAVASTIGVFTNTQPIVCGVMAFLGAATAVFFGSAAIRLHHSLLATSSRDLGDIELLRMMNSHLQSRLFDMHLRSASGYGARQEGATPKDIKSTSSGGCSSLGVVLPINGNRPGKFTR